MVNCEICNQEFGTIKSLHGHLKSHKIIIGDYYRKYFPRIDLYSGEPIPFKNYEQYFNTDFLNRENFKNWILSINKEEAKEYCLAEFKKRKESKNLKFSPSQVELKTSINLPPIHFIEELFGDYYLFCRNLGFENRYQPFGFSLKEGKSDEIIFIDSREQRPLKFSKRSEIRSLKFGDYCLKTPERYGNVYVERKNITDFISTLGVRLEQFCNELERAAFDGAKILVLVEGSINDVSNYSFPKNVKTRITISHVFHNMRDLCQKYNHIQFLFAQRDRTECSRVVEEVLFSNGEYFNYDIQLLYDKGEL